MPQQTLAELKTIILDQADMENSEFIDTDRLTYWINAELQELYDILVSTFSEYFVSKYNISVVSGTDSYGLPPDFFKALKVFHIDGTNRRALGRFMLEELDRYSSDHYEPRIENDYLKYRIMGTDIVFAPIPQVTGTIEMWYVPRLPFLTVPQDRVHFTVPIGWEDFVVSGCVIRCLAKQEDDFSYWAMRKQELKQHIIDSAIDRDEGEAERVSDVRGNDIEDYLFYE